MRPDRRRFQFAILFVGVMATSGCGPGPPAPAAESDVATPAPAELVSTATVRRGEIRGSIPATGSIVARRETAIGPAVPGRILHIFVDVGDQAVFGSPLFQIDPGPYAIALRNAEAGLALASAERDDARVEARRTRTLARKNMIASQEHTRARTRVAMAEARVEQAQARLESARHDLNRTLVLAPYAGSVVERGAHEGTMGTVTPNTRVIVLQESGALEAALDVPETSPVPARPGDSVTLHIEGSPKPVTASVRAVSDRIDRNTRTYSIRVPVPNPERSIKAGAFVRAEIVPEPRAQALLVEPDAVLRQEGGAFVFRVVDGRAERTRVAVGVVGRSAIELIDGVAEGERVVVGDAVTRLADGARIEVAAAATTAAVGASPSELDGDLEDARP